MLNLVRNLRFIVGDLVSQDNPYWLFYLMVLDITDILISRDISQATVTELEILIEKHNSTYRTLFQDTLEELV